MNAALIVIGDKLGLYKAMAGAGPMTSAELAAKTGTGERYIREWPFANDKVEDNLNPIGRVFYAASTMLCTPASLSQEVGLGLGAQAKHVCLAC